MRTTFWDISLYKVAIIAILVAWMLDRSGYVPILSPQVFILGIDLGFYILYIVIYALIWLSIYFMERLYVMPDWFIGIRSRQGTSQVFDYLILLACIVCGFNAIVAHTLPSNSYLICIELAATLAALQSIFRGRERAPHISSRSPAVRLSGPPDQ